MLRHVLDTASEYFVRQQKEWTEILVNLETKNRYQILDVQGTEVGSIAEVSSGVSGFLRRNVFGSHRALDIRVLDADGAPVLNLSRDFFFLFSSIAITEPGGAPVGSVERRWGILYKKYDLLDVYGRCFATISGPRWNFWTFPIRSEDGFSEATISKKWGGALREIFADADTYRVSFDSGSWPPEQRLVIFGAAISIDFDFFENNQGSSGLLDVVTPD